MPCGYYSDRDLLDMAQRDMGKATDRINRLTALLCDACRLLEADDGLPSAELAQWWAEHKAEDDDRIRREAEYSAKKKKDEERREYLRSVRERLMSQLTPDERKALGV